MIHAKTPRRQDRKINSVVCNICYELIVLTTDDTDGTDMLKWENVMESVSYELKSFFDRINRIDGIFLVRMGY